MSTPEPNSITGYTEDTTYVPDGAAAFYTQFKNKALLNALLQSQLNRVQEIENALWSLLTLTIDNSTGDALDQIGRLLNFLRGSLDDTSYQTVLKAVVRARRSNGTGDDVITVMNLMMGGAPFDYTEGLASILITPHAPLPISPPNTMFDVLEIAKAGGVQLELITPPDIDAHCFAFAASGLYLVTGDSVQGFSDTSQVTGGALEGVLGAPFTALKYTSAYLSQVGL